MPGEQEPSKEDFLYPRNRYYGEFTPQKLAFNANLQEFAQKVGYVCSLETGGKISTEEAYERVKQLWEELEQSKKGLGISRTEQDKGQQQDSP